MTTRYQPGFDIEPDFNGDRAYGEAAEETVRELLDMSAAAIEVKRKRRADWAFYVETAQSPLGTDDYKKSGINTTQAEYWAYAIAETGIVVFIPIDRLRRAARDSREVEESDGDNPTKGRLVDKSTLFRSDDEPEIIPW